MATQCSHLNNRLILAKSGANLLGPDPGNDRYARLPARKRPVKAATDSWELSGALIAKIQRTRSAPDVAQIAQVTGGSG